MENVQLWITREQISPFSVLSSLFILVTWSVWKETKMKYGMQKFDKLILSKREWKDISLWSVYTGREIACGLGNQVHELWTVLTSKVSLTLGKGYDMVQTGKNKSNGELPYY